MSEIGAEETKRVADEASKFVKDLEFTPISEFSSENSQFKVVQEPKENNIVTVTPVKKVKNADLEANSHRPINFSTSKLSASKKNTPIKV